MIDCDDDDDDDVLANNNKKYNRIFPSVAENL
jgi:hypothetical protein